MILAYIKGFLVLFLLIKVLLYFVPKNTFQKYIAFFAGVILVIGLLYPLLQINGKDLLILEKMEYDSWEKELLDISADAREIEQKGKAFVEEQFVQMVEETQEQEEVMIETITIDKKAWAGDRGE